MNYEKYLPVGSVVKLKDGVKRLVITGFGCKNAEDNSIYDYCGCLYPEGMIVANKALLFNHDQIERVDYIGLIDEEEKNFKITLNKILR